MAERCDALYINTLREYTQVFLAVLSAEIENSGQLAGLREIGLIGPMGLIGLIAERVVGWERKNQLAFSTADCQLNCLTSFFRPQYPTLQ